MIFDRVYSHGSFQVKRDYGKKHEGLKLTFRAFLVLHI